MQRQEFHYCFKLATQYSDPHVVVEYNLRDNINIKPYSILTNKTLTGRRFIVQTINNDYKYCNSNVKLSEKVDRYETV